MGFLDSLFKSAVNKTVNEVVGKAVDQAMNTIGNQINNQPATPAKPQSYTIMRPALTGSYHEDDTFIDFDENVAVDDGLLIYTYELADGLLEYDTCASEIPSCFAVIYAEDEEEQLDDYDDAIYKVPMIYFEEYCCFNKDIKKFKNFVHKKVIGHQIIEDRFEYDDPNSHIIAYRFYVSQANKKSDIAHMLTLSYNDKMDKKLVNHAINAFELIASTLAKK